LTRISLILFDLNGVLYRYDQAARVTALASVSGVLPGAIQAAIWDSGFEDSGDAGTLDADGYMTGFATAMGYKLSEAEWLGALRAAIQPIPAALDLLPRIRSGVRCAVLTNNNLLVQRHFSALYPEVAVRVGNHACVSAEFGARKPDPAVYRKCLDRLGAQPAATLFVDDNQANVAGATTAGLAGHQSTSPEDLAIELRERGLLS
jgi:putative hydrolase of the HAD superfamily